MAQKFTKMLKSEEKQKLCLERKWHQNGQCCLKFKINKNTYYGANC